MKSLQVYAFGKLQLQYGSHVVSSFPTRHVEELLGYFLLNRDTQHSREKLIGILWPHGDSAKSRSRLSTVLWRLRSLLSDVELFTDDCLMATRNWVRFSPVCPLQLDTDLFQQILNQAEKAQSVEREQMLQEALNLYKGDLFEGIYSDWCLVERERLARLRLRGMGQLMAYYQQRQQLAEAIDWGQAILQEDPLREEVHRAIMGCYRQMGLYPQAVRQFQTCATLLQDELGTLPLPETIAIYQDIITERFTAVPSPLSHSLQEAFACYQRAANRLNHLLDEPS